MRRAPLFVAWAATLAVMAGVVAWVEMGEGPDRTDAPTLTLIIPDRPAAPAPVPAEAPPAEAPPAPAVPPPAAAPAEPAPAGKEPVVAPVEPPAAQTPPTPPEPAPTPEPAPAPEPVAAPEPPAEPSNAVPTQAAAPPVPAEPPPRQEPRPEPPAERSPDDAAPAPTGFQGVDPRLVEDGPSGPLPVIGPLGRKPWQVYARPFAPTAGKARIAVVLSDLGLGTAATRKAVESLPPEISLAFLSYADDAAVWLQRARADGHEVLIAVPMEPAAKTDDPGPRALGTAAAPDDLIDALEWHLSRGSAYVGIATHMGGAFLSTESAVRTIAAPLRDRGLLMFDASGTNAGTVARVAGELGVPFAASDRVIDPVPSRAAIDRRLAEVEEIARRRGSAVAVGHPYPVTIDAVTAWAATLAARGFELAPLSAVIGSEPAGGGVVADPVPARKTRQ